MKQLALNRPEWSIPAFVILALSIGGGLGLIMVQLGNPLFAVAAVFAPILLLICAYHPEWALVGLFIMTYTRFSDVTVKFYGAPSTAKPYIGFLLLILIIRIWLFGDRPQNWHRAAFSGHHLWPLRSFLLPLRRLPRSRSRKPFQFHQRCPHSYPHRPAPYQRHYATPGHLVSTRCWYIYGNHQHLSTTYPNL